MSNLNDLKQLNKRLTSLLDDPQLGCFTWHEALGNLLNEIAEFSPNAPETAMKVKAECHSDDHIPYEKVESALDLIRRV